MSNGMISTDVPMPKALAGSDYRLKFFESFYALDIDLTRSTTIPRQWKEGVWFSPPNPAADITAAAGQGKITWHNGQAVPNTTMRTVADWRYGYIETRMKFDPVYGAWPAIWLGASESIADPNRMCGELDIMEWMSSTPQQCFMNVHVWAADSSHVGNITLTFTAPAGFSFNDWHTYGFWWTPNVADWYIDDQHIGSLAIPPVADNLHYYLMLGSQAGVNWASDPASIASITAPEISMYCQWVRVWQLPPAAPALTQGAPQTPAPPLPPPAPACSPGHPIPRSRLNRRD